MENRTEFEERAEQLLEGPLFSQLSLGATSEDLPEEAELYAQLADSYGLATAEVLRRIVRRRAVLLPEPGLTPVATGSYVGGHPFVPEGWDFEWPLNPESGEPMTFLLQVNFAEIPELEGFPTEGLLQWWIRGDEDTYGLDFGEQATGREGLMVKLYSADELSGGAKFEPGEPIPNRPYDSESDGSLGPLYGTEPVALCAMLSPSLFLYGEESTVDPAVAGFVSELIENGEAEGTVSHELVSILNSRTQVGGYPNFVQGDPRYSNSDERPKTLILQMESMGDSGREISMWGDMGNAQLFGDLEALRRGDTSEFWWHWACG